METLTDWANALKSGDPNNVTDLYGEDALLLATLEAKPLEGPEQIFPYFVNLAKKDGLHVLWVDEPQEVADGVFAGLYNFVWNGGSVEARYTFVVEDGEIIHHHSSEMP